MKLQADDGMWEQRLTTASAYANQALERDSNDNSHHMLVRFVLIYQRQFDKGLWHAERSVTLNPSDAVAKLHLGAALIYVGRTVEALDVIRSVMRDDPYHPDYYEMWYALALYTAGDYENAPRQVIGMSGNEIWFRAIAAACHAMAGRDTDTQEQAQTIITDVPVLFCARIRAVDLSIQTPVRCRLHFEGRAEGRIARVTNSACSGRVASGWVLGKISHCRVD